MFDTPAPEASVNKNASGNARHATTNTLSPINTFGRGPRRGATTPSATGAADGVDAGVVTTTLISETSSRGVFGK